MCRLIPPPLLHLVIVNDGVHDGEAIATQLEQCRGLLGEGHLHAGRLSESVVAAGFVRYHGAHFVISFHHVQLGHHIHRLLYGIQHVPVLRLADVERVHGVLRGGGVVQFLGDDGSDLTRLLQGGVDLGLQGLDGVKGTGEVGGDGFGAEGWVLGAAAELGNLGAEGGCG